MSGADFINRGIPQELNVDWKLTKPEFSEERFYVSEPIPETELEKYEGILKDAFPGLEVHSSTVKTSPLASHSGSSSVTTVRLLLEQKAVDTLRSHSERDSKESAPPGFAAQGAQGMRRALGPPPAPAGLPAGERDLKQREEAPPPYSGPLAAGRKAPPPPYSAAVSAPSVGPKEKPPEYQEREFKVRHEGDMKNEGDVKASAARSPQEIAHAREAESFFKEIGDSRLLEASRKIITFIDREVVPNKISGEGLRGDVEYKILNVRPGLRPNTFILMICPQNLPSRAVEQNRTTEVRLDMREIRQFIDYSREDLPPDLFPEPQIPHDELPPDLFPEPHIPEG